MKLRIQPISLNFSARLHVIFAVCLLLAPVWAVDDPNVGIRVQATDQKPIYGSTRLEVDEILKGWKGIRDPSHPKTQVSYYSSDAEIVVAFEGGRAVGVAVIARGGAAFSIPRVRELNGLVHGCDPKARTGSSTESGTTAFSIGPVKWVARGTSPLPRKNLKK